MTAGLAGKRCRPRVALLIVLAAAVVLAWLTVPVGEASAHAVLDRTVPERGAVLEQAPDRVAFTFNETVEAGLGAITVIDSSGDAVPVTEDSGPDRKTVAVRLPGGLAAGIYTVIYRVVSADSHPVSGGITFILDPTGRGETAGSTDAPTISELLADSDTGNLTRGGFWLVRWIGFLAIALAVGLFAWLVAVWRPGRPLVGSAAAPVGRRLRMLLLGAAVTGLASSLAAIVFQGAVATGGSFWSALDGTVLADVIRSRFGTVMIVRAGLFLALVPLALLAGQVVGGNRRGRDGIFFAGLVALALTVTPAFSGHASVRDPAWLLTISDILHVAAMSIWAGGLAALIWVLPRATREVPAEQRTGVLHQALTRFSPLALGSVLVVAVSGLVQAVIEVGRFGALFDTAYGRAVTIKVLLLAVLVVLGWVNRDRVIPGLARRLADGGTPGRSGVMARRTLRLEVTVIAVVLAVTAALVSYPPPDSLAGVPESGSFESEGDRVEYVIDPATLGSNVAHIYIFDGRTGAPVAVRGVEILFSPPGSADTPIEARVRRAGPGHFVAPAVQLGIRGDWQVTVGIRRSRFEESTDTFRVAVR